MPQLRIGKPKGAINRNRSSTDQTQLDCVALDFSVPCPRVLLSLIVKAGLAGLHTG